MKISNRCSLRCCVSFKTSVKHLSLPQGNELNVQDDKDHDLFYFSLTFFLFKGKNH